MSSRSRAVWIDPRFIIGVVFVVFSIVGVWFVLSAGRVTQPVLVAASTLVPGQNLSESDVRSVDITLSSVTERYMQQGELAPGMIVTRVVEAGDLLPKTAVSTADENQLTTLVVPSALDLPVGLKAGDSVELWAATGDAVPVLLLQQATVAQVRESEGVTRSLDTSQVELIINRDLVKDVLAAMSQGSSLSVVPIEVTK